MTWNKKNDQFALVCGLRPSSRLLLRWILRRAKLNQVGEIEIDLRVFNAWIAKNRGRAYDAKTIREAIAQLDEKTQGLILVTKSYTPWIKKILVRPLEIVLQIIRQKQGKHPKLKTGNAMYSDEHKKRLALQQQQDISKLDSILSGVGLRFTLDNLQKLWRMAGKSFTEIKTAIEYLLHAHNTQKTPISNVHGWLVESLKHGWHKGFNLNYVALELPKFNSSDQIANFVDALIAPT
jgi:hydroxymethylpyrimidine pyrophosphatase-like HAD family hydrolase